MDIHSPSPIGSHIRAHTAKQGPSLPRPQHGLVLPAKSLLVRRAFIYIHFQVHCEPSLSAPALSQTIFHRVFQLLSQMAHVCFRERKRVHTRLSEKNRTQRLTRRNRGLPDGAAIATLGAFHTFTNLPGPGVRTANLAAFGPWPGVLSKNAESLRNSDALMRVAVPRRRGPAGLRDPIAVSLHRGTPRFWSTVITECREKHTSFLCTELFCQLCLRLLPLCCTL